MHGRHLDRFEREDDDFHQRVRDGFAAMAAADPQRWVVVDGAADDRSTVAARVRAGACGERLAL